MAIFFCLVLCSICVKVSLTDAPCQTFESFPEDSRRLAHSALTESESALSDEYIANIWYGSVAGLSTKPPGTYKCGTVFPVWAKRESAVGDGTIDVTVCTQSPKSDCAESFVIKAIDCRSYKVYKLAQTAPDSAYCLAPTDSEIPERVNKPITEIALTKVDHYSELIFRCIFEQSAEDVLYKVYWYTDDKFLTVSQAHKWEDRNENNALDETTLKDHGRTTVGFNVYCAVRASIQKDTTGNLPNFSQMKYVGIKLYNSTIYLGDEPAEIFFQLTAPFGCVDDRECTLPIRLLEEKDIQNDSCQRINLVASKCGVEVKKSEWDKVHSITVKRRVNLGVYRKVTSTSTMKLTTSPYNFNHGLWANYKDFGNIVVQTTEDTSMINGKSCYASTDPHIRTMDSRHYLLLGDGNFTLYTNLELQVEVQVETEVCARYPASCVCGIAVRAGRSIFAIQLCDRRQSPTFLLCDDVDDVLDVRRRHTNRYEVLIPSGTVVHIYIRHTFMNVKIVPSIRDINTSRGLCGKLSDTSMDDFVMRDGTQASSASSEFSESWRVQDVNNLFDRNTYERLEPWHKSRNYCSCPKCDHPPCGEVECGPMQEAKSCLRSPIHDKGYRVKPEKKKCSIHGRKRRSVPEPQPKSYRIKSINKRDTGDWLNGWTKETATAVCAKRFARSPSAQICKEIPTVNITKNIEDCVFDIWASGNTSFVDGAVDNMQSTCMLETVRNSTLHQKTEGESMLDKVFKVLCPSDCRGKGDCVNGECRCYVNFAGPDCSVDLRVPPVITGVDFEGLCDVNEDACAAISLFGSTFIEKPSVTCRFREFANNEDLLGKRSDGSVVTADFENLFELSCPIPVRRRKRSALGASAEDDPVPYHVSVSNNGIVYSEEKIVVVYNSICQTCSISDISVDCVTSDDYCTIGTQCIPKGGRYPGGGCLVCDINGNEKTWQEDQTCGGCIISVSAMWMIAVFSLCNVFLGHE